jgi:hypothetical protein
MFDVMTLAFQTDTTRIATFLVSHDGGNRPYPFVGVSAQGHHHIPPPQQSGQPRAARHHRQVPRHPVWVFPQQAEGGEGGRRHAAGQLHDCVRQAGISDGNEHSHDNLPTILAGRGGGTLTPGRHLQVSETPSANLYVAMLKRMGVPTTRFGDSTGDLEIMS